MAIAMRRLKVKPSYEQLIGVASSDGLEQTKFPNRDAKVLREGFTLSQLDGVGTRQMQLQQEEASRHAFKEIVLKHIAINTGSNLSDMNTDSDTDSRKDRVNRAFTTPPMKPKAYDMTLMDETPFETPHYENPIASDLSHRINRRLDFEEQEEIDLINEQEQQIENIKKETIQHLGELQPKRRHIGVETKTLTRSYLDRVYETVSMKAQAREYIKKEFQRLEQEDI